MADTTYEVIVNPSDVINVEILLGQGGSASSGGGTRTHYFNDPVLSLSVAHNLGNYPQVVVHNQGGAIISAEVLHIDTNVFFVYFDIPTSGFIVY